MKSLQAGKRPFALAIAVVLAGVATVALFTYVHGAENRAYAGVETIQVYVAKQPIPAGTTAEVAIAHDAIGPTTVPRKLVAAGAVTSLSQIQGRVASVTIEPGEQILLSRFTTPGDAATAQLAVPDGLQAMSVEVDTPPGGGGFVQPGSHVSILAHVTVPRGTGSDPEVAFILQNIEVLAVGQSTLSSPQNGADNAKPAVQDARVLLTLALSPQQAVKLGYAVFEGAVYFTVDGPNYRPSNAGVRNAKNELS